ncbi:MAG: hypothetical protein ACJ763_18790, partial [Bdellovibrionia bacterium]
MFKAPTLPQTLFCFLLSLAALSAEAQAGEDSSLNSSWKLDASYEGYGSVVGSSINSSSANPGNGVLQIPQSQASVDSRPSFTLQNQDSIKLILQPRWQLGPSLTTYNDRPDERHFHSELSLTQGYAAVQLSEQWLFAAGVQNYQWGPAELLTASNPMSHFSAGQRSILWVEKGHGLVRLNFSSGQNISAVVIGDLFDNNLTPANSGGTFSRLGLAKVEYQVSPASYAGLSAGSGEHTQTWVGEYGSLGIIDGLSIYGDARQTIGSNAVYLVPRERSLETLADLGIRFEDRVDARSEVIINTYGYDRREFQQLLSIASQSGLLSQGSSLPGLEFPGKTYLYESVRLPEVGYQKRMTLNLRYIHSLMDQSGVVFFNGDQALTDHLNAVFEISVSRG